MHILNRRLIKAIKTNHFHINSLFFYFELIFFFLIFFNFSCKFCSQKNLVCLAYILDLDRLQQRKQKQNKETCFYRHEPGRTEFRLQLENINQGLQIDILFLNFRIVFSLQ